MDDSPLVLAAFALGAAGNLVKGLPQFFRTAIRGRVAGLAPGAVWLAVVANVLWLCFGIAIHDARFTALSAVGLALTIGTLLRFLARAPCPAHRLWAPGAVATSLGLIALAAEGLDAVLAALGVLMGVLISLPQLLHLWRRRAEPTDVSGVSQTEIVVVVAAQLGWTTYWVTQGQLVVAAGAAYGLVTRAVTLLLLRQQLRRGALASPVQLSGRSAAVAPRPRSARGR